MLKGTQIYVTLTDEQKEICKKRLASAIAYVDTVAGDMLPDWNVVRVDNESDPEQEIHQWCYETKSAQTWDADKGRMVPVNKPLKIPVITLISSVSSDGFVIQWTIKSTHVFNTSIQVCGNDVTTHILIDNEHLDHPVDIVKRLEQDGLDHDAEIYTRLIVGISAIVNEYRADLKDISRQPFNVADGWKNWRAPVPIEQVQKNVSGWLQQNGSNEILSSIVEDRYEVRDPKTGESLIFHQNIIELNMSTTPLIIGFERFESLILRKLFEEITDGKFDPFQ